MSYKFIQNFTAGRKIKTRVNGVLSETKNLENGVPQGSILSVTLFLISIDDAGKDIKAPIIVRKYADDICIICKGINIVSSQKIVQKALDQLF